MQAIFSFASKIASQSAEGDVPRAYPLLAAFGPRLRVFRIGGGGPLVPVALAYRRPLLGLRRPTHAITLRHRSGPGGVSSASVFRGGGGAAARGSARAGRGGELVPIIGACNASAFYPYLAAQWQDFLIRIKHAPAYPFFVYAFLNMAEANLRPRSPSR